MYKHLKDGRHLKDGYIPQPYYLTDEYESFIPFNNMIEYWKKQNRICA